MKAIKNDVRGHKFLMTRKVERKDVTEKGPVGHLGWDSECESYCSST